MNGPDTWGWKEVIISIGLMLPALLIGQVLVMAAGWLILGESPTPVQMAIPSQAAAYLLWLGGVALLFRTIALPFWRSVAWHWPPEGLWRYLALGPALAVGAGLAANLLQAKNLQDGLMDQLLSDPVGSRLLVMFGVTGAPMIEELLFRGIMLPVTVRAAGVAGGLLITSVPFAMMHGPMYGWSWQHLLLLILVGVAFGVVRLRSGSTLASTITHGAYNLMMFAGHFLSSQIGNQT